MNTTSALPEGAAAVELAGAVERVGAAQFDAFKHRLQPECVWAARQRPKA